MPTYLRKPSLKDIAHSAGVSVPTVSRILNNRSDGFSVRPEVRERVCKAAMELSYRPHLMAQSLRKNSMGIVGLLGIHMPVILPEDAIRGMVDVFEAHSVKLSTYFSPSIEASHDLPPWRIDGAIVASVLSMEDLRPLERARLPYVSINGWSGPRGGSVNYDDADGTRQALSHLVALGHRRIAYANARGPWRTHPSVQARHHAYVRFLKEAGLEPVPGHDQPWTEEE
ncbi:MAG: LacI family transcriptional regulator, partial [Phycisphaerales bacterium]|nr:LacI family transcriptional regulator [Phycisphaerales bacterium]